MESQHGSNGVVQLLHCPTGTGRYLASKHVKAPAPGTKARHAGRTGRSDP